MPSLLRRLGHQLAVAVRTRLIRCKGHGDQPWAPACACVLEGEPPAQATMDGVFCARHLERFADHDERADDDVRPVCLRCLTLRGLLG